MLIQNTSNTAQVAQPVGIPGNSAAPATVVSNSNIASSNNLSPPEPSPEQLNGAVNSLNNVMQQSNISLSFSVNTGTNTPVVSVTDSSTGQVVAQFPSKATLAIAQAIDQSEKRQGLLLSQKA